MKKLTILLFLFVSFQLSAQDRVVLKSGDTLQANVVEISEKHIKVKENDCLIRFRNRAIQDIQFEDRKMGSYYDALYSKNSGKIIFALNPYFDTDYSEFRLTGILGYFILPKIELNANFGFSYLSAGANIYLLSPEKHKLSPFLGYQAGYVRNEAIMALPVGLKYQSDRNIEIALLVHIVNNWKDDFYFDSMRLFLGLSIGWQLNN